MQPDLMAKRDGFRIAAMFPANTEFDLRTRLLAQLDRHFQQLADTNRIQGAEWVRLQNILLHAGFDQLAGIITRQAKGHLR